MALSAQIYSGQRIVKAANDAFGRQRVSQPQGIFNAQFTYDRQPLIFDTITQGAGTSVLHDATNKQIKIGMAATPTGGKSGVQSFEFIRYQPGKSQLIFLTFNMHGGAANCKKYAGYTDGTNGIQFVIDNGMPKFEILSATDKGNASVDTSNWVFYEQVKSRIGGSVDFEKTQILVIDFEALYVGRVRVGFNIDGFTYYVHEFNHANVEQVPYFQTANLPISIGLTSTGTTTDSVHFICSSVISEGGQEFQEALRFSTSASVTAANGTDTHVLSITPKTTFAGQVNRAKYRLVGVNIFNESTNDVIWKICIGQAITSPTTSDANTTYSGMEVHTGGTLSGSPAIIIETSYLQSGSGSGGNAVSGESSDKGITALYPISLDHEGNQRDLGKVTLLAQGIGGTADIEATLIWEEIR
jgi:hypothetical protein